MKNTMPELLILVSLCWDQPIAAHHWPSCLLGLLGILILNTTGFTTSQPNPMFIVLVCCFWKSLVGERP
uniref:Uncharacterized protein n=1 Tax=Rhizophora mucronata TaxID=61149 RepID=A0A2P2QT08_RHIMU